MIRIGRSTSFPDPHLVCVRENQASYGEYMERWNLGGQQHQALYAPSVENLLFFSSYHHIIIYYYN